MKCKNCEHIEVYMMFGTVKRHKCVLQKGGHTFEGMVKLKDEACEKFIKKCSVKYVMGNSCPIKDESIHGITEGKQYVVTCEGKDEIGVINDLGEDVTYSSSCFKL